MYLPNQGTTAINKDNGKYTTTESAESQTKKDKSRTVAKKKQTSTSTITEYQ